MEFVWIKKNLVIYICDKICNLEFINTHKNNTVSFTRERKLSFVTVLILVLRNSVKSLQVMLNEFVLHTKQTFTVTASAFCQARHKLKHTAFIELNNDIVAKYYAETEVKRLHGFRLTAFDCSIITLPASEELKTVFGARSIGNHTGKEIGEYTRATFEVCYDVLNNIALGCVLSRGDTYEADLVTNMLDILNYDDLAVFDRGYACFPLMARFMAKQRHFLIRCPKSSFNEVQEMFLEDQPESKIVTLNVPAKHAKSVRLANLPSTITIRLVKVELSTGEIEVLITSLTNESFTTCDFKYLYGLRWGVETFFGKIKGRLALENFTGTSLEVIRQDFWSTIFVSNLETILTENTQAELNNNTTTKYKKAVNKAVSFNTIKNMAFDIFTSRQDPEIVLAKLTRLFTTNTVAKRPGRKVKQCKISDTRSLNFQKKVRKHVF